MRNKLTPGLDFFIFMASCAWIPDHLQEITTKRNLDTIKRERDFHFYLFGQANTAPALKALKEVQDAEMQL